MGIARVYEWGFAICYGIQFMGIWVLLADWRDLHRPTWLFPLTGRWLGWLARGGLLFGFCLGLYLALTEPPDPDVGSGGDAPAWFVLIAWICAEVVWLGLSATLLAAGYFIAGLVRGNSGDYR